MYRRRLFYDVGNGEVLRSYAASGRICADYPPQFEAEALGLTNWGAFSWEEFDPEAEARFSPFDADGNARTVAVRVDVSGEMHNLVFEYAPSVSE